MNTPEYATLTLAGLFGMTTLKTWTVAFVIVTFGLYLGIAWLSRVKDTKGFFIAGGGVPAPANGMATAADWMSAASFISMAGLVSGMGFAGGVYLMGWTGGYVLLALLLAPYLRKFGHFTVPDFIGDRYAPPFWPDRCYGRWLCNPCYQFRNKLRPAYLRLFARSLFRLPMSWDR